MKKESTFKLMVLYRKVDPSYVEKIPIVFWSLLLNILPLAISPVSFGNCDKSKEHLNEKCNKLNQDQRRSAMEGSISMKSISLTS